MLSLYHYNNILQEIRQLGEKIHKMSVDLTALTAAVNADATVEASAVTLINGIAAEIAAAVAGADPATQAQLNSLVQQLQTQSAALAAAVASAPAANTAPVANTPSSN